MNEISKIKLYSTPLSGHGHRVEQFLNFLQIDFIYIEAQKTFRQSKEFFKLNPLREIPVLVDHQIILYDSCAILIYLSKKYAPNSHWLPTDPIQQANIQRWLSIASSELKYGCATARGIKLWNLDANLMSAQKISHHILKYMNEHLKNRKWLETDSPTIADIACYGYVALAPEGGIVLDDYTYIQQWLKNFEALPHFRCLPSSLA